MKVENIQSLKKILSDNGYKITKAREDTFLVLLSPEPQSMAALIEKAKNKVDRVTMYRNIDLFEKLGIVNRIYVGWKYKLELSDNFMDHHHHLSCLSCGKVVDIEDEQHINEFIKSVTDTFKFTPRHHQFEIDGFCSTCTESRL
jgi:Fe2+ or Zn2+ uptake regulation protein